MPAPGHKNAYQNPELTDTSCLLRSRSPDRSPGAGSFAYQSGVYAFPFAGLTAASAAPAYGFMSYRIADPNPVVWQTTARVTWRAGEDYNNKAGKRVGKCNDAGDWPPVNPKHGVVVSSYFWYYDV